MTRREHVVPLQRVEFGLIFFKRFLKLSRILFPSVCHIVTLLFVFILALSLLEQYIIFNIGLVPSKFYKVLGDKDRAGFTGLTVRALLLILAEAFLKSTITYVTNVMYITWRKVLSTYLHSKYFRDVLYYQVNVLEKDIDNPDQRITQDVDKMCSAFSQILTPLIISPFTIGYYMYQAAISTGYIGPVSILCFFLVATLFNKFLMSPVVNYFYKQERMEGDFRFKHMQMRTHSEAVAFYRSGALEEEKTNHRLGNLINTQHQLYRREYCLNFFINVCDYVGSILSYIALAFPIFAGKYDDLSPSSLSALISKNAFVCIYLISCFTKLIDLATQTTDVAGTAHRIAELLEHLGCVSDESSASYDFLPKGDNPPSGQTDLADIHVEAADNVAERQSLILNEDGVPCDSNVDDMAADKLAVSLNDVTYGPPKSNQILCRGLSLEFTQSSRILITGDSGCGKSSLLRVISGLWPTLSGTLERKEVLGPRGVLFLPQLPYFTDGSLREQVIYPLKLTRNESADDQVILENLAFVGLSGLLERIGGLDVQVDWNWYDELSPGEMQRLSFVRLFYHKPPFAVLDEATSQMGHQAEGEVYGRCEELGIAVLSVGHRHSLRQYHHTEIHIHQGGAWSCEILRDGPVADIH